VTYKITVQMPGRRWWSQSQTRIVESVDTAVRLVWPRVSGGHRACRVLPGRCYLPGGGERARAVQAE
jgi:hypothetical protein